MCLSLEGSIPKVALGHSAGHIYDIRSYAQTLEKVLLSYGVEPAVSWEKYRVRRLDVSFNFNMGSLENAREAYERLATLRHRGKIGIAKNRERLAYWPSKTNTLKFYVKWDEMIRKSQDYSEDFLAAHEHLIKPLLRHEQEWRGKKLIRFVGCTKIDEVTIGRLAQKFDNASASEFVESLAKQFSARGPAASLEDLFEKLRKRRQPNPLIDFAVSLLDHGYEYTRKNTPKSSFYDKCKILKELGFPVSSLETHFDKPIQPTLDLSEFISVDKISTQMDEVVYTGHVFYDYFRAYYNSDIQFITRHSSDTKDWEQAN